MEFLPTLLIIFTICLIAVAIHFWMKEPKSEKQERNSQWWVEISLKEAYSGTKKQVSMNSAGGVRTIEVKIPAGMDNNSKIKVNPSGMPVFILNIKISEDVRFRRNKNDLYTDVDVGFDDLILGCEIEVEHLTGKIALVIPANTLDKQLFKISGRGMTILNGRSRRGDLFVKVNAK